MKDLRGYAQQADTWDVAKNSKFALLVWVEMKKNVQIKRKRDSDGEKMGWLHEIFEMISFNQAMKRGITDT